jgi:formate transporter
LSPSFALKNLFSVTIGNMVGGALVGVTYWLIYLRKRRPR